MLLWGFIFLAGGLLTGLVLFLSNLELFSKIGQMGFGGYVSAFFDKANLTTAKTLFVSAFVVAVLGLVLYLVGRAKTKKSGEDNPVIPVKVTKFFRDVRGEYKKVVWPTFASVVRNTGVVLAMCAVTGVVIILVDIGLGQLINLLLSL